MIESKPIQPIVTFVLISYLETDDLYVSLGSLLCQKNPNWQAIVWHDGPNELTKQIVEDFNDERIVFKCSDERRQSWGIYNRIDGYNTVTTPFIVNATVQEYFTPNAVEEIAKHLDCDFIHWNVIHHSFNYYILNSDLKIGRIDWSNFAIKTEIAKQVGVNNPTHYCADGIFVEDCYKSGLLKTVFKLDKIITIKN